MSDSLEECGSGSISGRHKEVIQPIIRAYLRGEGSLVEVSKNEIIQIKQLVNLHIISLESRKCLGVTVVTGVLSIARLSQ